jgi:hypothetical protein
MSKLERWAMFYGVMYGEVYDDIRFRNGEVIKTTEIVSFDKENMVIQTKSGSFYQLGESGNDLNESIEEIEELLLSKMNEGK